MHDLIARLRTKPGLEVVDREQSWELRAHKPGGLVFEITLPHDILEWFVTVRQPAVGQEVWSDWMDYYAANGETKSELRSDMGQDVEQFVERLLCSAVRIRESRTVLGRRHRLEWQTTGAWEPIFMR